MSWWQKIFGGGGWTQEAPGAKGQKATQDKLKRPPRTGDLYVDSCFDLGSADQAETRRWDQMADFQQIWTLLNARDMRGAQRHAEALVARYPDFDVAYSALARVLKDMGNPTESTRVKTTGIAKSRRKALLLDELAITSFDGRDLSEAVALWIKSCSLQMISGRMEHAFPFVKLSYVASALSMKSEGEHLLRQDRCNGSPADSAR